MISQFARITLLLLLLLIAVPAIGAQDSYECDTPECVQALIESMGDAVDPDEEICITEDGETLCLPIAWFLINPDSGSTEGDAGNSEEFCAEGKIFVADDGTVTCIAPDGWTVGGDDDSRRPSVGDEVPMSCDTVDETLYCQPDGEELPLPAAGEAPDMDNWNCFSDDSGTERCYPYGYTCYGDQDGNSMCYEQLSLFDDTESRSNNISGCPNIEPNYSQQWVLQLWNNDWITSVYCPRYYPDPDKNNCQWTPGGLVCTLLIPS